MNPYIGFKHHGNDIIPMLRDISAGVISNKSIMINCVATDEKDRDHPNVK